MTMLQLCSMMAVFHIGNALLCGWNSVKCCIRNMRSISACFDGFNAILSFLSFYLDKRIG